MKKQTAVEWHFNATTEIYNRYIGGEINHEGLLQNLLNSWLQAKEMEKQELEKFYNHGQWAIIDHGHGDTFEDYYNRTYGEQDPSKAD
jgi:hypothetical protein